MRFRPAGLSRFLAYLRLPSRPRHRTAPGPGVGHTRRPGQHLRVEHRHRPRPGPRAGPDPGRHRLPASVRIQSGSSHAAYWPVTRNRPENATALYWASDYFAASQYYEPLLGCRAGINTALFGVCNHAIDAVANQALHAQVTDPGEAQRLWQRVSRMVLRDARVIPTGSLPGSSSLISRTTGNSVPVTYTMGLPDLDQLWVR